MFKLLGIIRMLFNFNGKLSGYKTYIGALAGVLAVTANFLTGDVTAWVDGEMGLITFVSKAVPEYIAMVAGFWTAGALRAGISK